jgi:hypothetical protein
VRDIEESDNSASVCSDVLVAVSVFVVGIVLAFIMRFLKGSLIERVPDAFVEDLFGVLWSIRTFRSRNDIVKAELVQKRWEVVWVIFDIELFVKKMLNLLFFQGCPSRRRAMSYSCSASSSFGGRKATCGPTFAPFGHFVL